MVSDPTGLWDSVSKFKLHMDNKVKVVSLALLSP